MESAKEGSVDKVKGAVESDWLKVVRAEERSKLLRELVKEGLGTDDVENFMNGQRELRFKVGKGNGEVECGLDRVNIINIMKTKLDNSIKDENQKRLKRNKLRAKLERLLAKKKNNYKKFIHRMREKMSKERVILVKRISGR